MNALSASLVIIYILVFIARMWPLHGAWISPLFYGERYFLDVPVPDGFYQNRGSALLRRYRVSIAAPYVVEFGCFLFLLATGRLNHLVALMLAGVVAATVTTIAAGRIFRREARRLGAREEETAASAFASPLEARRLASYTNVAVEVGLAAGNIIPLVLLSMWHRAFHLPLLLIYIQIGLLLIKHALVEWRTAMPALQTEAYLEFREQIRKWFIEMCDWMRIHSAAFLASYTAFALIGDISKDMTVRWAILTPWTALAATMIVRLIYTSNRLRRYGRRLDPPRVPRASSRAQGFLYYNPDDPALLARSPLCFNFANRRTYIYLSYIIGFVLLAAV